MPSNFFRWKTGINGKITGNDAAYIYPRSNLALVGKFQNNQMISAQKAIVENCKPTKVWVKLSPNKKEDDDLPRPVISIGGF